MDISLPDYCRECGTARDPDRYIFGGIFSCPLCTLAEALGYKIEHNKKSWYDATATWVKKEEGAK